MSKPKIVFWDLETLPDPEEIYRRIPSIGAWPGRTFKADIQSIMCFGYKIDGNKKARSINAWDFPKRWKKNRNDDYDVCKAAYDMLVDADEIVTHNGVKFDLKVLQTRLAFHGLPSLPKLHHVDTVQSAKRGLSLYSNSLDNVAKFFGCESKMKFTDKWEMWVRIAFKNESKKDIKDMDRYCKQDVEVLEQIYHKLMPHHGNKAVNRGLWVDPKTNVCPTCGSKKLQRGGYRIAGGRRYVRVACQSCGSWSKLNIKEDKVSPL